MPLIRLSRAQRIHLSRRLWQRRLVFWGGALAVGGVSVGFAALSNHAQDGFAAFARLHPFLALAITPAGFALSVYLCRRFFPGAQGSGIPQAMAARILHTAEARDTLLSPRLMVGKIALTLLGLACGASIGREGPTVQVGASIMLQAARWGGIGRERGLILAGSAAGVAAAFNTPLAGIVFAIEEMSRAYEARTSFLVLSAVIVAGLASLGIVGNYSYFGVTNGTLNGPGDWAAVVLCGVAGGALGGLFSRLTLLGSVHLARFVARQTMRRALGVAIVAGLAVALIGLIADGATFGTGYEQARSAIEGHALARDFVPLKLLATLLSTLAGLPGGIFAPSLAVGAGIGSVVAPWFPAAGIGAVIVLGMAGYFSGVVQAPITAFVIITEMTGNHSMVLPTMAASVIGYGVSRVICPSPLYHTLADAFVATQATASRPAAATNLPAR